MRNQLLTKFSRTVGSHDIDRSICRILLWNSCPDWRDSIAVHARNKEPIARGNQRGV